MKKTYAVAAMAILGLTGCSDGGQTSRGSSETAKTTVSPTATPSPTPTVMTVAEAGKFYLATVCPSNIMSEKTNQAVQAEPFNLKAARAATAALRDSYRKEIETLENEKVLWPASVKRDIATLADGMYTELSSAVNVANQTTDANFIASWNAWTDTPAGPATAQKIRVKLGLPSDTTSSCKTK